MAPDTAVDHKFARLDASEFPGLSLVDQKAEDALQVAKLVTTAVNGGNDAARKAAIPVLDEHCFICDVFCKAVRIAND